MPARNNARSHIPPNKAFAMTAPPASMIDEPSVACPYCGEIITIVVDVTAGDQSYVEDCFVCCQPIVLHIVTDDAGELADVRATPENG